MGALPTRHPAARASATSTTAAGGGATERTSEAKRATPPPHIPKSIMMIRGLVDSLLGSLFGGSATLCHGARGRSSGALPLNLPGYFVVVSNQFHVAPPVFRRPLRQVGEHLTVSRMSPARRILFLLEGGNSSIPRAHPTASQNRGHTQTTATTTTERL